MDRVNLDSNVLIRYIAQDDEQHSRVASELIEAEGFRGVVTPVVLVEVIWVLLRLYSAQKADIVRVVDALLTSSGIEILEDGKVAAALERYQKHSAVFSDCLIIELGQSLPGCKGTVTFDKKAAKAGMKLLASGS
ncbi:Predicted nucleic-acid-binding protein, contains PIN domain [Microbulbifer donghaiensis]|uniref:Predicted nucleic-acid-binding protein, contains PIN domain n=1 Tax=Microbulbifer donghaiensis TaxID=494016 RepID=A0A1M4TXD9_9GAMM|nr:PIN domain-containing protein [Microbulbifer donghaiensis]SHE49083.1 Predicted nucleic-acid-binding protein, contains PIN domain [Microbulbifer donghaiensis]